MSIDLRDYFAAKAMQALITYGAPLVTKSQSQSDCMEEFAITAYKMADNMLRIGTLDLNRLERKLK